MRTLSVAGLDYAGLVVLLRLSGNRPLSKMNFFDVVVTVTFGSALASLMITNSVSLAQGLTAIALLIALQYIIMWLSVRLEFVNRLVKTSPILLLFDGELLQGAMHSIKVTEDEIHGALRQKGIGSLDQAVVALDTDGSLSVTNLAQRGTLDTLKGVRGIDPQRSR